MNIKVQFIGVAILLKNVFLLELKWAEDIKSCPELITRSTQPVDVTDLRPDDIGVIMAIGDSTLAGYGANLWNFLDMKMSCEYRGLSFIMGGDPNAYSIANFIRHYKPELVGYSKGNQLIDYCPGGRFCPPDEQYFRPLTSMLNAAISGAFSNSLDLQIKYITRQATRLLKPNEINGWKMVTIFIGIEELCHHSCDAVDGDHLGSPAFFEQNLGQAILKLRARFSKLLVNILLLPDMSQLFDLSSMYPRCREISNLIATKCPCAMSKGGAGRWALRRATAEFNSRIIKLTKRLNLLVLTETSTDSRPRDFGVINTPLLRDTDFIRDIPANFVSRFDCFHPSVHAHKSMATGLW